MAVSLFGPKVQFFDTSSGASVPLDGGKVYAYEAGTSTPKNTYTTSDGDVANTNPVILDSEGRADIYLGTGFYKIVVKDSDDNTIFTTDDYEGTTLVLDAITSTSTTSVAVATGTKTFEIEENKAFPVGGFVVVYNTPDPTQYMHGQVTDYTGTTLEVSVGAIGGSGTYAVWTVALSGPRGATGATGASGGGSGDMVSTQNLADLDDVPTALANLGIGTAGLLDVGTTASKVVQLNASAQLPAVDGSLLTGITSTVAAGAVTQSKLATSTGSVSTTSTTLTHLTLPGGEYGFFPQLKMSTTDSTTWRAAMYGDGSSNFSGFTSYATKIGMKVSNASYTFYAQQRYVTSSPPFDLGDGDTGGFIFLLIDSSGKVISTYAADVPPWAYNGPTNIRADIISQKGFKYRKVPQYADIKDFAEARRVEASLQKITNDIKNADMDLIPHPFDDVPVGHTVVLLDPMSEQLSRLIEYQNLGGSDELVKAITTGKIYADNEPLKRKGPKGVMQAALRFR